MNTTSLLLLLVSSLSGEIWNDDPRYPPWAQRGRILYLDNVEPNDADIKIVEGFAQQGATPFIHAFTPHWPFDPGYVDRLEKLGIPSDVRVEGSLFFEDDHIDRFAFIHGEFRLGGWWYNHAWRTNYDWYRHWPESLQATSRMRNGDEFLSYAGHIVTTRREGSPIAPQHRTVRAKQIDWLLAGVDPLPKVPLRSYENPEAKDPQRPYPQLGRYHGLWYDNPSTQPSYDVSSREAWEVHFEEKFGERIVDPPSHPDKNVRNEWARFWAEAWADFYLWRKNYQDEVLKKQGKPLAFSSGNFSNFAMPQGSIQFYLGKRGIVDMLGPAEYETRFNRGRFHFLIKTALAATHGRPAGKFYPNDLEIAESLAVSGTNTFKPGPARFLAAHVDLYGNTQPGGRIGILWHTEQNLVESQLVNFQELADQLVELGFPYEVVMEDHLEADLAKDLPLLIIANTDLSLQQTKQLQAYVEAGGKVLLMGDCTVEKPRHYHLKQPPAWSSEEMVAARAGLTGNKSVLIDERQFLPLESLRSSLDKLGGPGVQLAEPDGNVLLNILRQPKDNLLLANLVNYSGAVKNEVVIRLPRELHGKQVGWISRDGGGDMLAIKEGTITIPELRFGCTILMGDDRKAIADRVTRSAELFPRPALEKAELPWRAMEGGPSYTQRMELKDVPAEQTLCRHRIGSKDRGGYLLTDVLAPQRVGSGQKAEIKVRILDTSHGYVEYWQVVAEDRKTGKRIALPIDLPADNPHGARDALAGTQLVANWQTTPEDAGSYQLYLAYRACHPLFDGEPNLTPPNVVAGYSGSTPANLFLKSQPLVKRPYEDRLRGLRIEVMAGSK